MKTKVLAKDFWLRVAAAFALAIAFILFMLIAVFVTQTLHNKNIATASGGYLRLEEGLGYNSPVYLNGDWQTLHLNEELYSPSTHEALFDDELTPFPIGSLTQAYENAAYKINLHIPKSSGEGLVLAVPTYSEELNVYLNGELQKPLHDKNSVMTSKMLKILVSLDNIHPEKEWQELVITAQFSDNDVTLFERPVVLGTAQNISMFSLFDSSFELFVFGMLLLVFVNGFVFMLFRPNHLLISLITLFDTLVMLRIIFSMNFVKSLIQSILPYAKFSDEFCGSVELFFLMITGIFGCLLSGILFDPQKKAPRFLITPMPIIYGIFALAFPFNMHFFEAYGRYILVVVYIITFIGVFCQFIVCWKSRQKRGYYTFQAIKTVYIGLVIFWDIAFWTQYKDFFLLLCLYTLFFMMHVIVRLYDNNESYHYVEVLNQSLEATVQERTKELSDANQILSELSVRDPLTKAFNRLYFEKFIEESLIASVNEAQSLHLCIFDLDYFKRINDTYGHIAGDDMLKKVTEIVSSVISEDVMFARIGGEEFVLLYQGKTDEEVLQSVENVRETLEKNASVNEKYTTASFGISAWKPGSTKKSLMKHADAALYDAKNNGRNQTILYQG